MAKIPGVVIAIIGIGVFIVTAYAKFEKNAKIIFTVIAALLILYGVGSMAIDISNKRRQESEKKKTKFDYMPQSMPARQQQAAGYGKQQTQAAHAQQAQRHAPSGIIGFCSVCGYTARSDDNFCGKCGARLK